MFSLSLAQNTYFWGQIIVCVKWAEKNAKSLTGINEWLASGWSGGVMVTLKMEFQWNQSIFPWPNRSDPDWQQHYVGHVWIISTSKCAIFAFIYISFLNTQILCFCSMLVHIKPKFKSFVNYVLALRLAKTTKLFSKSASNLAETTSSSKFNFLFLQNFHQAKLFLQSGANLPRIYLYLQVEISKNI